MTDPATNPCPFCHNGSVIDSNGAAWRCAECNGSGRVLVEAGGVEDDDVPFLSDEARDGCQTCSAPTPYPMRRGWVPSDALHPFEAWKPCPACQRDRSAA